MSEPKRYEPSTQCVEPSYQAQMIEPIVREVAWGNYVRYEDYARLKKEYDDLEYCRGHVPYAQHRSAVDKWTELFHKTADNFDKVVAENASLKAEVERLKSQPDPLTAYLYAAELAKDDIKRLKAQVERLTKAGDELHVFLISYIVENRISSSYLNKLDDDWNAAKEGKGQP